MYYQVGTQQFTNKFSAAHHAANTNQHMHFNMYESAFDRVDWTKEPDTSWDQLLDIRAQQIAAKNKPIVLNFSGGSDSYTIYEVFKRNNIHIDVLYMRRRRHDSDTFINVRVDEFLNQGIYDKTTKIIMKYDDEDVFTRGYANEDWIWTTGIRYQFSLGFAGDAPTNAYISELLGTNDFISVIGFEKPRLIFTSMGVYSYQDDINYTRPMGDPLIDCFYISPDLPELHVKQSYLMLNYIKQLRPASTVGQLAEFNNMHDPRKFDWDEYSCKACGRFGDLSLSGPVHACMHNTSLIVPESGKFVGSEYRGPGQNWFSSLVGTKTFDNYIKGIMNIINDKAGDYLLLKTADQPLDFFAMKMYKSKYYKLTF